MLFAVPVFFCFLYTFIPSDPENIRESIAYIDTSRTHTITTEDTDLLCKGDSTIINGSLGTASQWFRYADTLSAESIGEGTTLIIGQKKSTRYFVRT